MNDTSLHKEVLDADTDTGSFQKLVLDIVSIFKYVLSKYPLILFTGFVFGLIGLGYAVLKKPIYQATISFALEDDKAGGGLGAASGLASQFGIDLGGGGSNEIFSGDNLLELIKSRNIIEKTLLTQVKVDGKNETLADMYVSFNKLNEQWDDSLKSTKFLPNRATYTKSQDSLLGGFYGNIVKNNLVVQKVDKKLSIITLNVNSKNELFSKLFVEKLVITVSDFYIDTKTKKATKNVNILRRQTDSVRRELNLAITGVASSVDVNPNPNPSLQILRVPSQRRQVDVQANQAILTQLVANLTLAEVALLKQTPLIQVIDKPILPLNVDKVSKLKGAIIGMVIGWIFVIAGLVVSKVFKRLMQS